MDKAQEDLSSMRLQMKADSMSFIDKLTEMSDQLNFEQKRLREDQTKLGFRQDSLDVEIDRQKGRIAEIFSRQERSEIVIVKHGKELERLDTVKCELSDFTREVARIDEHMRQEDIEMKRIDDHCIALDQYLDKYQPVRMEDAVT